MRCTVTMHLVTALFVAGCASQRPDASDPAAPLTPVLATTAPASNVPASPAVLELSGLRLAPDPVWVAIDPSSRMRAAEFTLGARNPGDDDASLVVYYFGPGSAGSVESNIDRWCGQFDQPGGADSRDLAVIEARSINGLVVHTIDLGGIYVAETSPGSGERVHEPEYHLLAAIVETRAGPYYIKLVGPAATVQRWRRSYEGMLDGMRPAPTRRVDDGEDLAHP